MRFGQFLLLRRHRRRHCGWRAARDRPFVRRPAQAQPAGCSIGSAGFPARCSSWESSDFFMARIARRRVVLKKLAAIAPGAGRAEAAARGGRAGLHRRPAPSAGTPARSIHAAGRAALLARRAHRAPHEIPRDRDVVLYCTCPSEATAAKTAMELHKLGIERVRPLRGGFDEWKRLGYPLDAIPPVMPMVAVIEPARINNLRQRRKQRCDTRAIGEPMPLHGSGPTAAV